MAELYDNNDVLITSMVSRVIPSPDVIEVKNRTLDGGYTLQTIGSSAKTVEVSAVVTLAGKNTLDSAKAIAAPIKVTGSGRWHKGVIDGDISPEYLTPNLYRVTFTILQQSEGAI